MRLSALSGGTNVLQASVMFNSDDIEQEEGFVPITYLNLSVGILSHALPVTMLFILLFIISYYIVM